MKNLFGVESLINLYHLPDAKKLRSVKKNTGMISSGLSGQRLSDLARAPVGMVDHSYGLIITGSARDGKLLVFTAINLMQLVRNLEQ
jgi:hypothetical protein